MSTPGMVPGLVSVIIPVFNRSTMLRQAVGSALAQSYRPIEIIIVDDESTDDTVETIAELVRTHSQLHGIRQQNGGPGAAREQGRLSATGEYIQYLDSDDLLVADKFEKQVAALLSEPGAGVAYGRTRYRDAAGRDIRCTWKNTDQVVSTIFPSFLLSRWWETATPLYRRSITDAAGPWTRLRLEEDWEYDCRVGALGVSLVRVASDVAIHRDHPEDRLSRGDALAPARLKDRAEAHVKIFEHARRAGIEEQSMEMQHFGRELFHLGRRCGAADLEQQSTELLELATRVPGTARQAMLYIRTANLIGWRAAGMLAEFRDRLR